MKTTLRGYILNDWDLIVATLHWNGVAPGRLSTNMWEQAWSQGDGYGKMSRDELKQLGLMGDWSHVRDSSPEAIAAIAYKVRTALGGNGLLAVQKVVAENGGSPVNS